MFFNNNRINRIKNEKGASAVEFAIVLPVLALILFGIIEFGILLYNKAVITNASREGARNAILFCDEDFNPNCGYATIAQNKVLEYCQNRLITFGAPTTPSVTTTPEGSFPHKSLRVRVTYNYSFLVLPNFGFTFPGTLTAETVMRQEYQGTAP